LFQIHMNGNIYDHCGKFGLFDCTIRIEYIVVVDTPRQYAPVRIMKQKLQAF
jgi:hypothetical protein